MKRNLSHIIASAAIVAGLASCGPTTYSVTGEKQVPAAHQVEFGGKIPGIVTLMPKESPDSVLVSSFAIGMAEQLEADLAFEQGTVPVFYLHTEDVELQNPEQMRELPRYTGTDVMIVVDSMRIGEFSVRHPEEQAYYNSGFMQQTIVSLPYSVSIHVYKADSAFVDSFGITDVNEWNMLTEKPLSKVRAVEEADKNLAESFARIGAARAEDFTGKWETFQTRIYVYDSGRWWDACRFAYLFEWDKAMEIWMEEAKSRDRMKAACAAYNISVACRMLGMDELSAEWKFNADKMMGCDSAI